MRRGQSGINALVAIDKPLDITSHDVVDRVRSIVGERRVGHCGTLDPAASGVLLIGIGSATRLSPYLMGHDKVYRASIVFGAATDTDDADGRVISSAPCPDELMDPFFASSFVASLVGEHMQVPPAFCAIKRNGITAYRAAREGEALELEPRPFQVYSAALISIDEGPEGPLWEVELSVSKGTYIRAMARDIGETLATKAHLCSLRRLRSGFVSEEQCVTLDELEEGDIREIGIDPVTALGLPAVEVGGSDILSIIQGKVVQAPSSTPEGPLCVTSDGVLLSIHECTGGILRARTVFSGGVIGVC